MNSNPKIPRRSPREGFTLAEILIAMLVFAIAITTILALLARSIETVDEIVLRDEAMRLSSAVESHMGDLPFNDAYHLVRNEAILHTMHYRGRVDGAVTSQGALQPVPDRTGTPGVDFLVVPSVHHQNTDFMVADFHARTGRYFQVKLEVSGTNPVPVGNMDEDPDNYESAVIVIYAEFYPMPTHQSVFSDNPNARPVYSYNFAVRR